MIKLFEETKFKDMLKVSVEYLLTHSEIPRKKMEEFYSLVPENQRTKHKNDLYKKSIAKILKIHTAVKKKGED